MQTLESYVESGWVRGSGAPRALVNPASEEVVAETSTEGVDIRAAVQHARDVGGPALRALTFAERGAMLKTLAKAIVAERDTLLNMSMENNGSTRSDAKFDVDGASFTLQAYGRLGESLGDRKWLVDGEAVELMR